MTHLPPGYEIRRLSSTDEYNAAEELQAAAWGVIDRVDITPKHVLVTAQKNGGLVLGTFTSEQQLVGFLFGFLGQAADHKLKHVSHQMGVHPDFRGLNLGYLMKRAQRGEVRRQGLDLITWTYDPLETVNAALNLTRLGAVCHTFLRNVYGEIRDSLNRGLPSDRFQVDWWIRSEWVHEHLSLAHPSDLSETLRRLPVINPARMTGSGVLAPSDAPTTVDAPDVLLQVPFSFQTVKATDMAIAYDWRIHTREAFERLFAAGYVAVEMLRGIAADGPVAYYRLVQPAETPPWRTPEHAAVEDVAAIPDALAEFKDQFNQGRYWKAHEALEAPWGQAEGTDKVFLQGLIRMAAAFHKLVAQRNTTGAARHLDWVIETLEPLGATYRGVDLDALLPALRHCRATLDLDRNADHFDRTLTPMLEIGD